MKGFLNEFKDFAMKGNVLDLAVGVVMGRSEEHTSELQSQR